MNDITSPSSKHLGLRLAIGAVGLVLIALLALLGSVAMKQSATSQSLQAEEALGEDARPAPIRE